MIELDENNIANFNHDVSYDADDEEYISLYSGGINQFDKYAEKYIDKNKYIVYLLLKFANPMKKIRMLEYTTQNIIDVSYSKKLQHNCIYIFYNLKSQKVKSIKYMI